MKLKALNNQDGRVGAYIFWCQGCQEVHAISVPRWGFNGNMERPTFTPSVRHLAPDGSGGPITRTTCHYFVTDGSVAYCSDSPHALAGQTVPLVDIPLESGWAD